MDFFLKADTKLESIAITKETTNKYIKHFFTLEKEILNEKKWELKCKCCQTKVILVKNQEEPVVTHLTTFHPFYQETFLNAQKATLTVIDDMVKSQIYPYLKVWVHNLLPLHLVAEENMRSILTLPPISQSLFKKYLELTNEALIQEITVKLPKKIGLIIDGWIGSDSVHYVVLYAVFPEKNKQQQEEKEKEKEEKPRNYLSKKIMLGMVSIDDYQSLGYYTYRRYFAKILEKYHKSFDCDIAFLVANTSDNTNSFIIPLVDAYSIPIISCKTHILYQALLTSFQPLIQIENKTENLSNGLFTKINNLMKSINSNSNQKLLFCSKCKEEPYFMKTIDWPSLFHLVGFFLKVSPQINELDIHYSIKLIDSEIKEIKLHYDNMIKFNEVIEYFLHHDDINFEEVYHIFMIISKDYEKKYKDIKGYLFKDDTFSVFENAIKNKRSRIALNNEETILINSLKPCFKIEESNNHADTCSSNIIASSNEKEVCGNEIVLANGKRKLSYCEQIIKKIRLETLKAKEDEEIYDLSWIPITTSIIERTFSKVEKQISYLRTLSDSLYFEHCIMLYANSDLWNEDTVNYAHHFLTKNDSEVV